MAIKCCETGKCVGKGTYFDVCSMKCSLKVGKLLDYELSGSNAVVLKNPKDIYPLIQIGKVEFLAQNGGLEHLGAQNIKNEDFLGCVLCSFYKNLAVGNRIGVKLKPVYVSTCLGTLCKSKGTDKKEKDEVKVLHKVLVTKAMPQI